MILINTVIFTYGRLEKIHVLTKIKTHWVKSKKYSFQDASDVIIWFSCDFLQKLLSLLQDGSRSANLVHLLKESTSDTFLQWLMRRLSYGCTFEKYSYFTACSEVEDTKLGQQVHLLEGLQVTPDAGDITAVSQLMAFKSTPISAFETT